MENLERYLEYLEYQKHYSTYTVDNYRMDLEEFFVYLEKNELLERFPRHHIQGGRRSSLYKIKGEIGVKKNV